MDQILVAPSLLSSDFGNLASEIERVVAAGADWIHVDVMDGHFVPNITIGPPVVSAVAGVTDRPLDVHLMIEDPDRYVEAFATAGATILTVHAEATTRLWRTVARIRELGLRPAVALSPASPLALVMEVVDEVDMVLLMTVEPGFGGQAFIPKVMGKVKQLRDFANEHHLSLHIQVDGGIDRHTAPIAAAAGADVLVAGTAVFGAEDFAEAINALRRAEASGA